MHITNDENIIESDPDYNRLNAPATLPHEGEPSGESSGGRTESNNELQCPLCSYRASNSNTLSAHLDQHENKLFVCDFCEYETNHSGHFNQHLKTHSTTQGCVNRVASNVT